MFLTILFVFSAWPIETDCYLPLRKSMVAAADEGLYVLNTIESRITHFDWMGETVAEFGRAGQGPGERSSPHNLAVIKNDVVVCDSGFVNVFSLDGGVLRRKRTGQVQSRCLRTLGGWVSHSSEFWSPDGIEAKLIMICEEYRAYLSMLSSACFQRFDVRNGGLE